MALEKRGSKIKQWVNGVIANIPILTYGMQSGWISPSIPILQGLDSPTGYPLTDLQISLIASAISVCAVVSSMVYSMLADRWGRKICLIAVAVPQAIGWIIKIISADPTVLIISQCFCGIAGGGVFSIIPVYTKEISEDSIRGMIGSVGMSFQSIGYLSTYGVCAYLDYHTVLWIVTWLPVVNCILLLWVAESPPYLVKMGRLEEAKKTLAYLTGRKEDDKVVLAAMSQLTTTHEQIQKLPKVSIKRIFADKASRRAVLLGLLMITILDTGGNFAILAYASIIIRQSGVTIQPHLQAMSIPAIMLIGSFVSAITVEKFGRKILLLTCLILTALPMAALATELLLQSLEVTVAPWLPVLSIVFCIFSYGAGVLPVPYIVMSEIISFEIRAKCLGVYVMFGWFLCFLQVITFSPISQALGMYSMFYIYSGFNFIGAVLCCVFMPETKGLSSEEIQVKLRGKNK